MDFAGPFEGKMILVVIDSHSKWIEAFVTNGATSQVVIELSRTLFAQFGIPEVVVTDNGSCLLFSKRRILNILGYQWYKACHFGSISPFHQWPGRKGSSNNKERTEEKQTTTFIIQIGQVVDIVSSSTPKHHRQISISTFVRTTDLNSLGFT